MGPGLYVHVPFCARKCAYCAFFSRPAEPDLVAAWFRGIEREWKRLPEGFAPESMFFGGGTPTVLAESDLAALRMNGPEKYALAWLVRRHTGARPAWIKSRLRMGTATGFAHHLCRLEGARRGEWGYAAWSQVKNLKG